MLSPAGCQVKEYLFEGDPPRVVENATQQALHGLADAVAAAGPQAVG